MAGVAFFNQARSPLAVAVAGSDVTIQLVSGGPWAGATGPFTVMIENEAIRCSGINGNILTVAAGGRGFDQTSPQPHALTDSLGNPTMVVGAVVRRDLQDAFARLDTAVSQTMTGPLVFPPSIGGTPAASGYGSLPMLIDVQSPSGVNTFDFLNPLPTGFAHLEIVGQVRGDTAAQTTELGMRNNGDAAANYAYEDLSALGTAAAAAESGVTGQTSGRNWFMAAASALVGAASQVRIFIPNYNGTTFKKTARVDTVDFVGTAFPAAQQLQNRLTGIFWNSAVAINKLTMLVVGAGNFAAGSKWWLYGWPG